MPPQDPVANNFAKAASLIQAAQQNAAQKQLSAQKLSTYQSQAATAQKASEYYNSPLGITIETAKDAGKTIFNMFKGFVGGTAGVAASVAEGVYDAGSVATGHKLPAPVTMPKLNILGGVDVETFRHARQRRIEEGQSPTEATAKGVGETIINEPFGLALKPLSFALKPAFGVIGAVWPKIFSTKTIKGVEDVIKGDVKSSGVALTKEMEDDIKATTAAATEIAAKDTNLAQGEITKLYDRIEAAAKAGTPGVKVPRTLNIGDQIVHTYEQQIKLIDKAVGDAKEGTGGPATREISTTRFQFTPTQEVNFSKLVDTLGLSTRSIRTFKDLETLSREIGSDPKNVVKMLSSTKILTDAEVATTGRVIKDQTNTLQSLSRDLTKAKASGDEKTIEALNRQFDEESHKLEVATTRLLKSSTEAGRALNANRIIAQNITDPNFWVARVGRMLQDQGQTITPEIVTTILGMTDKRQSLDLAAFVAGLRKSSNAEKLITLWKAGLLTSIPTHLANVLGNVTMQTLMTASDTLAVPFDVLAGLAFSGKRTVVFDPLLGYKRAKATIKAVGSKEMGDYVRTGLYDDSLLKKYDVRQTNFGSGTVGKVLQGYTDAIFRALGAEDLAFRKAAISTSLEMQAKVIAKNENLGGKAYKDRIRDLLEHPTNEMQMNAIDTAEYSTFQKETSLDKFISGAERSVVTFLNRVANERRVAMGMPEKTSSFSASAAKTAFEVVAPFRRTPSNIAARLVEYSPISLVQAMWDVGMLAASKSGKYSDAYLAGLQKNFVRHVSRGLTGTGVIAAGAWLGSQGLMTGNIPKDPSERSQFYAEGKRPTAINLGGRWYQLNRISPLGNLLALGSEFDAMSKNASGAKLYMQSAGAAASNLTDQTFLKGVSGALGVLNDPERNAEKYADSIVQSVVPSIIARVAKLDDPILRNPDTMAGVLAARIPELSKDLPKTRDVFGKPVRAVGAGTAGFVDPFSSQHAVDNPILNETRRVGEFIGLPDKTQKGFTMSNADFDIYMKLAGPATEEVLARLMHSPKYTKAATDDERKTLIQNTIQAIRRQANQAVLPAIIIHRLGLEHDTPPAYIFGALDKLNRSPQYTRLPQSDKDRVLKNVLKQLTKNRANQYKAPTTP